MFKILLFITAFSLMICNLEAQLLNTLKQKVVEKTTEKIEQKVDDGISNSIDSIDEALTTSDEGQADESIEAENGESAENSFSANGNQQELQTYSKFDFIPGDEVIFFDDFNDVAVGDFPLKWNTTASGEIVTINNVPGKWFKMMEDYSYYSPEMNVTYPENFTIEFDVIYPDYIDWWMDFYLSNTDYLENEYYPGEGGFNLILVGDEIAVNYYSNVGDGELREIGKGVSWQIEPGERVRYSIWGQKQRLRVYQNEKKVIDIPRAIPQNHKVNELRFGCIAGMILGNFRFAVGAPDTRSRLLTEGKLITRGITFDSGSDVIKPESYPVIKEIADVLKENSSLRIKVIGHTDSDGADDMNLTLSKRRSVSVKSALEKQFGIDASRIETDGKGESEPVSQNSTPEGKANNRRVEFIKIS